MADDKWIFKARLYPHFDHAILDLREATALVTDPQKVTSHTFHPFLEYDLKNRKFAKHLEKLQYLESGEDLSDFDVNKLRSIKYASHSDAQIFSYYRFLLSQQYEKRLHQFSLNDNIIAYRKVPISDGSKKGKCNIHFAKEAFDEITKKKNVIAITLDISNFFDSLDHAFLQKKWYELIKKDKLPPDHEAVFKAITNYSVVNHIECYEKLGLIQIKKDRKHFLHCPIFIAKHKKMLCSKKEYRQLIVANGLVKKNDYGKKSVPQGIPQGSPISDILANLYMIDFDLEMKKLEVQYNAYYRRYSDDILWICAPEYADIIEQVTNNIILLQGKNTLNINCKKTTKTFFKEDKETLAYDGDKFSYLGFTFDGKKALYRNTTISNYKRKVTFSIQSFVKRAYIKGVGDKNKKIKGNELSLRNNLDISQIFHKIGYANKKYIDKQREKNLQLPPTRQKRVENNFMSYNLRALKIFNEDRSSRYKLCTQQLNNYKEQFKKKIIDEAKKYDPDFNLK